MKDKEKYTETKTTRLTRTQVNKLVKLGATIRDAVVFYIERMENPKLKLIDRKRELETRLHSLEIEIKKINIELEDINNQLGTSTEVEQTLSLDIIMDGDKIIEAFKSWNKSNKASIEDYFNNKQFKRMFEYCINEHGAYNPKEYENKLLNYIRENHLK